jgi:hypothetical protein
MRILIVEDDDLLGDGLRAGLRSCLEIRAADAKVGFSPVIDAFFAGGAA